MAVGIKRKNFNVTVNFYFFPSFLSHNLLRGILGVLYLPNLTFSSQHNIMSKLTTQKSNWLIYAENIKKNEEQAFLSNFGEVKGKGLNQPNKKNEIIYAIVSISYYEHLEGDGSSFSIRKRMMVRI